MVVLFSDSKLFVRWATASPVDYQQTTFSQLRRNAVALGNWSFCEYHSIVLALAILDQLLSAAMSPSTLFDDVCMFAVV